MTATVASQDALRKVMLSLRDTLIENQRQAGEYTIHEYAAAHGLTYNKACTELNNLVRMGRIKFLDERRSVDGRMSRVFVML